ANRFFPIIMYSGRQSTYFLARFSCSAARSFDRPFLFKTVRLPLTIIHNVDEAGSLHLHLATFGHDMG
ncbi:hypothetical protein, partial [Virgibacillus sp. DJP39]|uniref:hypothetical protein n=1 Tax=Virgibacillus sp. DJP39 TaxID=3409790 RepID=UPI003BB726D0